MFCRTWRRGSLQTLSECKPWPSLDLFMYQNRGWAIIFKKIKAMPLPISWLIYPNRLLQLRSLAINVSFPGWSAHPQQQRVRDGEPPQRRVVLKMQKMGVGSSTWRLLIVSQNPLEWLSSNKAKHKNGQKSFSATVVISKFNLVSFCRNAMKKQQWNVHLTISWWHVGS